MNSKIKHSKIRLLNIGFQAHELKIIKFKILESIVKVNIYEYLIKINYFGYSIWKAFKLKKLK